LKRCRLVLGEEWTERADERRRRLFRQRRHKPHEESFDVQVEFPDIRAACLGEVALE
jgi:hypothetical protein